MGQRRTLRLAPNEPRAGAENAGTGSPPASVIGVLAAREPSDRRHQPVSLIPCDACGERAPGKLASATWAWWRADGQRVAYRQRLCVTCFAMKIAPLEVASREFSLTCPACGTSSEGDMDPIYLTVFVPGMGPVRLEMPFDAACAVPMRAFAQQGSRQLDDQGPSVGGSGPGPQPSPPTGVWAALGIQPRD